MVTVLPAVIAVWLLSASAGTAAAAPAEDAEAAYAAGDVAGAERMWRELATNGDAAAQLALAQYQLARSFENGEGVPADLGLAVAWYGRAAAGEPLAHLALARLYETGRGVSQDFVEAYKWYNLAIARLGAGVEGADREHAEYRRDAVGWKMLPEHVIQAQRLAREWRPRP